MDKKEITKEEIIAEYLTGNISYRVLGEKYSIPLNSLHSVCRARNEVAVELNP